MHCKELGPNVAVSIEPSATYEDLIQEEKHFSHKKRLDQTVVESCKYFLADAQGSKLLYDLKGKSWVLGDYLLYAWAIPI